jgi:two-component system, OmpR family, response regulator VicR
LPDNKHSVLEEFVRILIIDDDSASTDLLKLLLASFPAEVVSTNFPRDGIELARKLKPDLILLDLWMPELNGLDVCKAIRRTSSVPILILSALDTPETIAGVLDAGADDYLVKPVTRNILHAYIKKFSRAIQTGPLLVTHAAL